MIEIKTHPFADLRDADLRGAHMDGSISVQDGESQQSGGQVDGL